MTSRRAGERCCASDSLWRLVLPATLAATLVASPTAISAAPGPPVIKAITASESPSRHRTVHTLDGRLETGWSVHGDGQWICYELDRVCRVRKVAIAWAAGEQRQYRFEVVVSSDGERWRQAYTGVSGGKTKALETLKKG